MGMYAISHCYLSTTIFIYLEYLCMTYRELRNIRCNFTPLHILTSFTYHLKQSVSKYFALMWSEEGFCFILQAMVSRNMGLCVLEGIMITIWSKLHLKAGPTQIKLFRALANWAFSIPEVYNAVKSLSNLIHSLFVFYKQLIRISHIATSVIASHPVTLYL